MKMKDQNKPNSQYPKGEVPEIVIKKILHDSAFVTSQ